MVSTVSFLHRVAGLRSSDIWERLKVEPLLFCIERSQQRWFRHLVRMPPGPWDVAGEIKPPGCARNALGLPWRSWWNSLGRTVSGLDKQPDPRQTDLNMHVFTEGGNLQKTNNNITFKNPVMNFPQSFHSQSKHARFGQLQTV